MAPTIRYQEIRKMGDFQAHWSHHIRGIGKTAYDVEELSILTIAGDAPKNFIRVKEYRKGIHATRRHWAGYIAKVGSKFYPTESITEQLFTRLGQIIGVNIAESQLLIIGGQVRFLSRYFL